MLLIIRTSKNRCNSVLKRNIDNIRPSTRPYFRGSRIRTIFPRITRNSNRDRLRGNKQLFPTFHRLFRRKGFFYRNVQDSRISVSTSTFEGVCRVKKDRRTHSVALHPNRNLGRNTNKTFPVNTNRISRNNISAIHPNYHRRLPNVVGPRLSPRGLNKGRPIGNNKCVRKQCFAAKGLPFGSNVT